MTDDELIKQLRDQRDYKCDLAADRIELLAASLAFAQNEYAKCADYYYDFLMKLRAAETKLAKAVKALRFYAKEEWPQNYPCGVLYAAGNDTPEFKTHLDYGDKARAVLAELEETE